MQLIDSIYLSIYLTAEIIILFVIIFFKFDVIDPCATRILLQIKGASYFEKSRFGKFFKTGFCYYNKTQLWINRIKNSTQLAEVKNSNQPRVSRFSSRR